MRLLSWSVAVALGLLAAVPAVALGPVDGQVSARYWVNEFDSTGVANLSSDAGAPGYQAELWLFKRYGLRAGQYSSDLDDFSVDKATYTSVDLMWRAFSPTDNNFFATGLGWQEMDLSLLGLDGDTAGLRINAEGRVALISIFHFYAHGSYQPSLDDADASLAALGRFEDLTGHEYELGLSWTIAPFIGLNAGYREQHVEFTQTGLDPLLGFGNELDGEADSSGFLIGLNLHF